MKAYILGTCSGTEPMPNRHHTSIAVEHNNKLYFFDTGESCAYTAYLMGLDLRSISKICFSHTHIDHIGGLPNLLWTVSKLESQKQLIKGKVFDIYTPVTAGVENAWSFLSSIDACFRPDFDINIKKMHDGVLFEEDGLKVTALHCHHIPYGEGEEPKAYGFLIEADGKRLVYTGDTKGYDDYKDLLPCDVLLTESGHHDPSVVVDTLYANDAMPSQLLGLIHHGRQILYDTESKIAKSLDEKYGDIVKIMNDKDIVEL